MSRKKLSLLAGKFSWLKNIALLRGTKNVEKKTCLAGKLSEEKKVCAFELCLVLSQKYAKSFGGKNLALCSGFVPSKFQVYV